MILFCLYAQLHCNRRHEFTNNCKCESHRIVYSRMSDVYDTHLHCVWWNSYWHTMICCFWTIVLFLLFANIWFAWSSRCQWGRIRRKTYWLTSGHTWFRVGEEWLASANLKKKTFDIFARTIIEWIHFPNSWKLKWIVMKHFFESRNGSSLCLW